MTTRIKPLRTEVATRIPASGALEVGELAVNIQDGKFYTKTSVGNVKEVGGVGGITLQQVTNNDAITDRDITMDGSNFIFEGYISNAFETTLTVSEPTADRVITLPDITGTAITTGNLTTDGTPGGDSLASDGDALAYGIVFGG
jgi:hypothetical protein|tara:strand:+ start:1062 stop:1493 length:432 start_codon:yes stop_codon:yes gene_type:complete